MFTLDTLSKVRVLDVRVLASKDRKPDEPPGAQLLLQATLGSGVLAMLYEDTSEGTPISPAFRTPEELARWLADNGASAFGDQTASYEAWLNVARGGWDPSAVYSAQTGLINGVESTEALK